MSQAVVVVDMGNEPFNEENTFNDWWSNNNCKIDGETIHVMTESHEEVINFDYYPKAKTTIFKFETDGDYFPPILMEYINALKDVDKTQISVAIEGEWGEFDNLVDMLLQDFKDYILDGQDFDAE